MLCEREIEQKYGSGPVDSGFRLVVFWTTTGGQPVSPFWGADEMAEWFEAQNFLRSERCCPRIESVKYSLVF